MNPENMGSALLKGAASPEVHELAIEASELSLDAFLDDGLVKDIPIIGSLVRVYRIGRTIRDALFLKKLWSFLRHLDRIPLEKRRKFNTELGSDRKRVGEALILLLDRLDAMEKPALIAKVFSEYMRGKATYSQFLRMAAMIERINLEELLKLLNRTKQSRKGLSLMNSDDFQTELLAAGMGEIELDGEVDEDGHFRLDVGLNSLGWKLLRILKDET